MSERDDLLEKALLKRVLPFYGFELDDDGRPTGTSAYEVASKQQKIIESLTRAQSRRKMKQRDFIHIVLRDLGTKLSKKEKQLLRALKSGKPVTRSKLINKTEVKDGKTGNLKALVNQMRRKLNSPDLQLGNILCIQALDRANPKYPGYILKVNDKNLNFEII